MAPARALTFGGVAARLTVPARRQDVAVLARLAGFRGRVSGSHCVIRRSGRHRRPQSLAQQRCHRAESMAGQLAWGSEVLVT